MNHVIGYQCTTCQRIYPRDITFLTCPDCGVEGILEVLYDYDAVASHVSRERLRDDSTPSIWRYLPLLPINGTMIEDTLRVGMTPLYQARSFQKHTGLHHLYIKDDGVNPTMSLKDRASVLAVVDARERGYDTICCSSTGNAASSLAGNAARCGCRSVIFVPKRAPMGKLAQLIYFGATLVRVDGDYHDAFSLSQKAIERYGWYNRNAAINPVMVEGKKTVAFEIVEQLQFTAPDYVYVSVGDGCTIAGVYKGFRESHRLGLIERIPKLIGVQSSGCDPFVRAWKEEKPLQPQKEMTLADSIAVGVPRNPQKAMNAVKASSGSWVSVSDALILEAMRRLGQDEGIFAEPAAGAAFAGAMLHQSIPGATPEDTVVVIATGNGLKDTKTALDAVSEPHLIKNDLSEFIAFYHNETQRRKHD